MRLVFESLGAYYMTMTPRAALPRLLRLGQYVIVAYDKRDLVAENGTLRLRQNKSFNQYCLEIMPGIYAPFAKAQDDSSFRQYLMTRNPRSMAEWLIKHRAQAVRLDNNLLKASDHAS